MLSLRPVLLIALPFLSLALAVPAPPPDTRHAKQQQLSNAQRFARGIKSPARPVRRYKPSKTDKRQTPSGVPIPAGDALTFNGQTYINKGLVAFGVLASDAKDSQGETIGGLGSAIEFEPGSWVKKSVNSYSGVLITQPDRGHNSGGAATTDYQGRQQRISFSMTPYYAPGAQSFAQGSTTSLTLKYESTLLYSDASGVPFTGLDPAGARPGAPPLPIASPSYDRVALDAEGLVVAKDGSYWVSDEYGPYIYHIGSDGKLISTLSPPKSILPYDSTGALSFTALKQPTTGRADNQGIEGLTRSSDGNTLWAVLQSGVVQDGGSAQDNKYTRVLGWDISGTTPTLIHHYVLLLPVTNGKAKPLASSDFRWLSSDGSQTTFILLSRDGKGMGNDDAESKHKDFLLVSTAGATNLIGTPYSDDVTPVAPGGTLVAGVTAIVGTAFIDMLKPKELARFGLQNGGAFDETLISGKWESSALAPCLDALHPNDYFLFSMSDNDFTTQNGFEAGKPYADSYGKEVNTQVLVWRVTLPSDPGSVATGL